MSEITRVGVDLAKSVIQVNAVDADGKVVTNRQLSRDKFVPWCAQLPAGCLVAMEACAGSHHWARKLMALGLNVKIIAPHLVAPYRLQGKGGKNDANDAAAICEAASRPTMRFVPVKTTVQQGMLCVHRLREGLKEERTASINRIRGMLAEFGLVASRSPDKLREKLTDMLEDAGNDLCGLARLVVQEDYDHWKDLDGRIKWCDERINAHVKDDAQAKAAKELMGVGPVTASAVVATVGDFNQFKNGAQFGAWLGLTPRQNSSGGKNSLGGITKRGDMYLRMLLIQGAKSVVMTAQKRDDPISKWLYQLREKSGWQKAAVAMANKNARILWAMMTKGSRFDPRHVSVNPAGAATATT
ncbi:IS110 family RNA-guided transposase [Polaromonas naphthalenivorans]|uniref:Transposase IS116/IS110/IS902 family protein n=1 Tax=Polaromonas naphthalenivorans (strain CJ2) TaxID=365044 RepID=A1VVT0_POLNA|nr:IS110 family transposase [Polaromonas naphthalenivorans]ABM39758.1 transposase IS116/IS110/IS902 family protein [Polaromonas naphthalenivorans CJ2]